MRQFLTRTLIILGAVSFIISSCEKAPFITISGPKSYRFSRDGGTQSLTLSCNRPWSVSSSESWVKVSPSSGTASDKEITLTINCQPNTTYDSRNATITIKAEELTETITVSQDTGLGLVVSPSTLYLTNSEQSIEIEIQKNVQYTVAIDNECISWIKQGGTKALTTDRITFMVSANTTYDDREGKITVKQLDGPLSETVIIRQSQTNGLFITTPEYFLSNESHSLSVEVKANVEYEVYSQNDWINYVETKGLTSSIISLTISTNESFDDRTGTVLVKQTNGDLTGIISITQSQTNSLSVTPTRFDLDAQAQTIDLKVTNNVPFSIVIPNDAKKWISIQSNTQTKALTDDVVVLTIAQNSSYDDREASVTIKQTNGSLCETVSIRQKKTNAIITASEPIIVYNNAQTVSVIVEGNVDYDIIIPEEAKDWIVPLDGTKGLVEEQVPFMISENDSPNNRQATILFKQKNGPLCASSEIIQLGDALTFKASDNTSVCLKKTGYPKEVSLEYSISGGPWTPYSIGKVIPLNTGVFVSFRATEQGNMTFNESKHDFYCFEFDKNDKNIIVSGKIIRLLQQSGIPSTLPPYCFYALFSRSPIREVSDLELPSQALSEHCFHALFYGCSHISSTPKLEATSLAPYCYCEMFSYSGIIKGSELQLPATTLASGCYARLFSGCEQLETAPALPATTLAPDCYNSMFENCESLSEAPILPATKLEESCYLGMFNYCRSLTKTPELNATELAKSCYADMFFDCYYLKDTQEVLPAKVLAEDCYAGMFCGTGITKAPVLPATELVKGCYDRMFEGCFYLSYIKAMFLKLDDDYQKPYSWTSLVQSKGIFVKNIDAEWDNDGIVPRGWTVEYASE